MLEFFVSALEMFHHGGWVMYPLLACSILVVAIGIERFIYYRRVCGNNQVVASEIIGFAKKSDWENIDKICKTKRCLVSDILAVGLSYRECPLSMKESFEEYISVRANALKRNLNYLDTIVTMAPLLGLLGTVVGMISSFKVLDVSGDNPALITGGVGEALIATATGLCVAVIALIVHSYFSNRLDAVLTEIETVCTLIINKARGK